ncbi:cytochrome P450 [Exidia glandulosa HHB12029]|uniref:Cytochrome P450 n=1 Tax=Exidia glandulosa HHB12029 TaxID=1314781 RepID=A0A165LI97_EXIGL|nr:cytochrome P450 [Exidia glandulosa HHB12029]
MSESPPSLLPRPLTAAFGANASSWTSWLNAPSTSLPQDAKMNLVALFALIIAVLFLRRALVNDVVSHIKGPRRTHWLIGNFLEYNTSPPASLVLKWARQWGPVVRMPGMFGQNILFISDVKAISHIFGANSKNYDRNRESLKRTSMFWPGSVVTVRHEDHQRHRRVLQPAFGAASLKSANEMFQRSTTSLIEKLDKVISGAESKVVDMGKEIKFITLDAIWLAGFGADLGSINNPDDPEVMKYLGLEASDIRPASTYSQILARWILFRLPSWLKWTLAPWDKRNINAQKLSRKNGVEVGSKLVDEKLERIKLGEDPGKDAISRLIKSNIDAEARYKFNRHELIGSIGMLHFAGHETTAWATAWALYYLTIHQDIQTALREEITAALKASPTNSLTSQDFEALPLISGVVKETLRLHPALAVILREAYNDDVLPLSQEVQLDNSKKITELPVAKNQLCFINVSAVNRDPKVYADPDTFNPLRWQNMNIQKVPGLITPYSGLLSFASGPRVCIGWRFAVLEIQNVISALVTNFHFEPAPGTGINSYMGSYDTPGLVSPAGDKSDVKIVSYMGSYDTPGVAPAPKCDGKVKIASYMGSYDTPGIQAKSDGIGKMPLLVRRV